MNAIKITLDKNASGKVAELYKDFAMYVNSYQNKLVDVYVPKEMLYTNPQNLKASETPTQFANSVKIGGILTADNGSKITTDSYYMDFLKETTINNVDYVVFERIMPKELTTYAGNQQIVINVLSVDSSVTPVKVLQVVTTQICNLLVQNSDYIGDETVVDPTKTEEFDARITQNKTDIVDLQTRMTTTESNVEQNTKDIAQNTNDIAEIKQIIGTGEDYIGTLEWTSATLPTDTELNAYVYEKRQRVPKSGDVVIVIQKLAGQTDKNFKYIYALTGWTSYEIPPMELAGNGTAGIVSGTYGIGKTNDTLVDIAGGEILNIYIKDTAGQYRNLVEYLNTSNTTIANIISGATQVGNALKAVNDSVGNNIFETYLTKEFGVTKAELRDYAMPREFNDVDFISSQGYQDNVPTTPESGIQFTATSATAGDTQLFEIEKTNTADFELSAKNGYSNTIYVSADKDCQVQFRLTTQYKKASGDWQNLNIELSSSIGLIAGNIEKLTFASPFTYLEENVISLTNGDKIRQVLEVVTTTLETIVFDVYSNQTYPSIFNLTSQSYTLSEMTEVLVVPESAPAETELVAISPQNVQQLIELGNGLELVNGHIDVVLNSEIAPFVDYSKAQNLTDAQKAQARANIGAGSAVVSVESVNGKTGAVVLNASDVGAVATSDIVDNLTTEDATKVLSANQGKVLADMNAETNQQLALAKSAITTLQNSVATNTENITQNTADIASNTSEINGLKTSLGTTNANVSQNANNIATNASDINDIEAKIPTQASSTNQLADKNFVNSSINNIAAFYITRNASGDAFETYAQLSTSTVFYSGGQPRTPTRNDYCIVRTDENHNNATTRYIYQGSQWEFQYIVNDKPFTSAQLSAINSGITNTLVTKLNGIETGANKTTVVQATGNSTSSVMSQKTTTDELEKKFISGYGTCSTASATSAKVVTIADTNWKLKVGTVIGVKFTNSNTASNVTLNVNNTGAKSIWYNTSKYTGNNIGICGYANRVNYYMYDGTYWVWLNAGTNLDTNTVPSAITTTAANIAAKVAACSNYVLLAKSYIQVIVGVTNTAKSALTLNINSRGSKPIYINGKVSSATNYTLPAGPYIVYYDGTNYYFRTDGSIAINNLATPNLTDTTVHTQTGNAVVIESYLSSDKKTWYRKWSDGWKECGGISPIYNVNDDNRIELPIAFSNTNYNVELGNIWVESGGHSVIWDSGNITDRTNQSFLLCNIKNGGDVSKTRCSYRCSGY